MRGIVDQRRGAIKKIGCIVGAARAVAERLEDRTFLSVSLLKDINPGAPSGLRTDPHESVVIGDTLYFMANESATRTELWKSDGTPNGTTLVRSFPHADSGNLFVGSMVALGGKVLFTAYDDATHNQLWTSDGTATGTVRISSINPNGADGLNPTELTLSGNSVFFSGTDGTDGYQLWKTDGTIGGAVKLTDANGVSTAAGFAGAGPHGLTDVNGTVYFAGNNPAAYPGTMYLWQSDGTSAGTTIFDAVSVTSPTFNGFNANGTFLFTDEDRFVGHQIWTPAPGGIGSTQVTHFSGGASAFVSTSVGNHFYFYGADSQLGRGLFQYDVSAGGSPVHLNSPSAAGNIDFLTHVGSSVFYAAVDNTGQVSELWTYDDVGAGFTKISTSTVLPLTSLVVGDTLYFEGFNPTNQYQLWKATATAGSATELSFSNVATGGLNVFPLGALGDSVYFVGRDQATGWEPWQYTPSRLPTDLSTGGPYTITEGDLLALHGSAVNNSPASPLTFSWEITDSSRQVLGTASGQNPTISWTDLRAMGISALSPWNIAFHADAGEGQVASASTTLTVNPSIPAIALSGSAIAGGHNVYTLTLGAITNAGPEVFTDYIVHWGDNTSNTYHAGGNVTHTYNTLGNTTITVDLTDSLATYANAGSKQIQVKDVNAPVLGNLPASIITPATSGSGAVVSYTQSATATDDYTPALTISYFPASGSQFPVGTTQVLVTATDAAGNSSVGAFNVTVTSTTAANRNFAFSAANYAIGENDSLHLAIIQVVRSGPNLQIPTTIQYRVSETNTTGSISFASGQRLATFTYPITDTHSFSDRTATLQLYNLGGVPIGTTAKLTTYGSSGIPAIRLASDGSVGASSVVPPPGGLVGALGAPPVGPPTGSIPVTVIRTGSSFQPLSVNYATSSDSTYGPVPSGTANPFQHFIPTHGTLTFLQGQTQQTISIPSGVTTPATDVNFNLWLFPAFGGFDGTAYPLHSSVTIAGSAAAPASPPIAQNDTASMQADSTTIIDALSNDQSTGGAPLSFASFDAVTAHGGTVQLTYDFFSHAPQLRYFPAAGFSGTDTFTYIPQDPLNGPAAFAGTVTVTVQSLSTHPTASFTAQPNPGSPFDGITFDASASDSGSPERSIVSYVWDFGDGTTAEGPLASHQYSVYGNYSASLTVTDDLGQSDTTSASLDLTLGNQSPFADAGGPYTAEIGEFVSLDGSASSDPDAGFGDSIISYDWDFDNDGQYDDSSDVAPLIDPQLVASLGVGAHTVGLLVSDNFGHSSTASATLDIYDPSATAAFTAPAQTAAGQAVQFDASASVAGGAPGHSIVNYHWDFGEEQTLDSNVPIVSHIFATAGSFNVTLTVSDDHVPAQTAAFSGSIGVHSVITARRLFYNNSELDNFDPLAGASDDAAIDAGKSPLLPGGAVSPANVSGYARGINGVMIDIVGLPAGDSLSVDDFTIRATAAGGWISGPRPSVMTVRRGVAPGVDRITLIWPETGLDRAVQNGWLEVTVPTANTGLAGQDLFAFGNLIGDTNGDREISVGDLGILATNFGKAAGATLAEGDFNGDGAVTVGDLGIMASYFNLKLDPPPTLGEVSTAMVKTKTDATAPAGAAAKPVLETRQNSSLMKTSFAARRTRSSVFNPRRIR